MMMTWLADVLRAAGLKVVEHDGWKTNGRGPMSTLKGVLLHHTGGPRADNPRASANPSLNLVLVGRGPPKPLPGPLSNLYLARDGTYHVLAAGRCNHAGPGSWHGATANAQLIGIEAENAGDGTDPWPPAQMAAYLHGVAAMLIHAGLDSVNAAGHKEYALPKGRKIDPPFNMMEFRDGLEALMNGGTVAPAAPTPTAPVLSMLRKGDRGDSVRRLQRILGIKADGQFGPNTDAAVRSFQREQGLDQDGAVGPRTWAELLKREKK